MGPASFVLDTSVTLGALFEDEQDAYSLAVLASMAEAEALVPALWHLELSNILARALKAGCLEPLDVAQSWKRLEALGISVSPTPQDAHHWVQRSVEWGLTTYDCCYLELARQRRLPLATRDAALAAAAERVGVALYLH
ncbi:MAG TPA: type II toxin-antitoxin system VapC family toxin [Methylibium sp.]|uniref:type II toxin-antitoxin system VapC family toxin n=1 Tax=Methylibium sp. TaxID=2067992 RepID=UPI002DBDA8AF|nr:type II toxin-antitoxin system VapC family toxin [Methylibium sp.]HEU4458129.1 type II toxin-antitoxin system VapC family toxin [Methylibium sp.]